MNPEEIKVRTDADNKAPAATDAPIANNPMPAKTADHNAPIGIISFAVLVTIILAGVAVFLYKSGNQVPGTTNQSATTDPATEQDVDDTSNAVDSAASQTEDDIDNNDLSDDTLGL